MDEVAHWGSDSPRVLRRLDEMLTDLAGIAPSDRRAAVEVKRAEIRGRLSPHG